LNAELEWMQNPLQLQNYGVNAE